MGQKIENLNNAVHNLLDFEKYDEARTLITQSINYITKYNDKTQLLKLVQLYCLLIDLGCESLNPQDLDIAIAFLESHEKELESVMTKSSYYYNLANAKQGIGKIYCLKNKGVPSLSITKERLQDPINLYWLTYKAIDDKDKNLYCSTLINLSNSMTEIGRIVEGLQYLDLVLRVQPNYPQALISRGDDLYHLSNVSNCSVSVALYMQIYKSYIDGIKTNSLPPSVYQRCIVQKDNILKKIKKYGFDPTELEEEMNETKNEYDKQTDFRKFCLDNFLTLNEHAIYCGCIATEKDDLQIGVMQGEFKSNVVPKLELLLNRIKSEFAFARWMLFKSNIDDPIDIDVKFSELLDNEIINSNTELLRTSYRICYGVLDKIALGICKLYNLETNRIHFEIFWDDKKKKAELDKKKNIHLNALYSIACDLNTNNGELKHFKNWRNKLEHNLLILKNNDGTLVNTIDPLKLYEDESFVVIVDIAEFKQKTVHLLQLTRAAIFSFVYCVRLETIGHKSDDNSKNYFNVDFKP